MKEWKQFIRGKMRQNLTKGSHCVTKIRLKKKPIKFSVILSPLKLSDSQVNKIKIGKL